MTNKTGGLHSNKLASKTKKLNELEISSEGSLGGAEGINAGKPNFNIIAYEAIKSCLMNSHILANAEVVNKKEDDKEHNQINS